MSGEYPLTLRQADQARTDFATIEDVGASIVDPQGTAVEDEPPGTDTEREWSDADLTELGNMLVRGLSKEEIARVLGRDHRDIRDKVAEVGRACR
jgi:hypothetical protein